MMVSNSSSSASWTSPGAGITGGYNGSSETLRTFIVFFAGLAMYSSIELIIMVLLTFKRFHGLYFWSMIVSGAGIIPYDLGFLLKFYNLTTGNSKWCAVTLLTLGWWPMITGQALVLWSRLHLIVTGERGDKILFWTKWMIVMNVFILHIPTTALTFGSNGTLHTNRFEVGYNIMEKIQMIGFFLQEATLSSIYIVETIRILRTSLQPGTRKTMKQLIFINIIIILMDLGLLGLECASLYILETLLKGVVYSIKLKLEFAILGKLVKFVARTTPAEISTDRTMSIGFVTANVLGQKEAEHDIDVSSFVDLRHVSSDLTHPSRSRQYSGSLASRRKSYVPQSTQLEYDLARFEHIEDVMTLREASSRDSRIAAGVV